MIKGKRFLVLLVIYILFSAGSAFSSSVSISSGYLTTGSIGKKGSSYSPIILGGQSSWLAALIVGNYWRPSYDYITRGVLKFDLRPWYELGLPKSSITAVQLYVFGGSGSGSFVFDVYSMLDSLETDSTINPDSTYYNSEDLSQGVVVDDHSSGSITQYIDTDFLLNDIEDGYDGITQTTYSGFVMMGYTAPEEFRFYNGMSWSSGRPILNIEYNETPLVPEPISFVLLGLGIIGLIKRKFTCST